MLDNMKKGKHEALPFKVGQLAESKCFIIGYRGAWFRCKIKDIRQNGMHPMHAMEYYDFPDEKVKWTRLYQKPPKKSNEMEEERELMVRPHYPRIYTESACPDLENISEAIVVTDGTWKVGDLVDWWTDNCYWSGIVIEIINDDMVKVELPEPPEGEGSSYEVPCKDLRPSLNWSVELGWTIPPSQGHEKGRTCARLIKPGGQGSSIGPSSTSELPKRKGLLKQSTPASEDGLQNAPGKITDTDGVSSRCIRNGSTEAAGAISEEERDPDSGPSKKVCLDDSIPLNSMSSDTVESLILDLEELVSRVKWVKHILESGNPLRESAQPAWEFLEVRIPTPKWRP